MGKLKKFKEYKNIDESSLEGNPGVPSEYLREVEDWAQEMMNRIKRTKSQDLRNFMNYVMQVKRLQEPFKPELEIIAEDVIRLFYGSILDNVKLNIKFPKDKGWGMKVGKARSLA